MDDERNGADFRKLIAWQRAMDLTIKVYEAPDGQPDGDVERGLAGDLRQAATTIPAKIAFGAGSDDPFIFLDSLALADQARRELSVYLDLARRNEVVAGGPGDELAQKAEEVGALIAQLRQNLRGAPDGEWFAEG